MTASIPMSRLDAALNGVEFHQAGVLFTVDGTVYPGAPMDFPPPGAGFSSDIAYGLMNIADGLFIWEGIGYPAAITPMMPSVQLARASVVARIMRYPLGTKIFITGYSQGALATDQVWTRDILPPTGILHDRLLNGDIVRIYNFGDPFRTPGIAHGNELAGTPMPTKKDGVVTGGIGGGADLRVAESNVLAFDGRPILTSFARDGDIYACCPVGTDPWTKMAAAGKVGNSIFKVIMQATFLDVVAVAADIGHPVGMVEEIVNGITFAAAGMNAPHWQYWPEMDAAIGEMAQLGHQLLAA
jgi:hypothetical protein